MGAQVPGRVPWFGWQEPDGGMEGKGGAENAISYYVNEKKIDQTRFYIIEGGIKGWPFPEMLESSKTEAEE